MDKKRNLNIIAQNDWLTGYATVSNSGIVFDDVECFRWRFFFNVNYAYGGFVLFAMAHDKNFPTILVLAHNRAPI